MELKLKSNLQGILNERGITRYRLVQLTGLAKDTIYNLFAEEFIPERTNFKTMVYIAHVLGEPVDKLYSVEYCQEADTIANIPTLFDLLEKAS